jgi:hypothetical protein
MSNQPVAQQNNARAATKLIALQRRIALRISAATALTLATLAGCSNGPVSKPLPFYRCYDVLYRGGKHASSPANAKPNSNEYSNNRMQVEFNLGPTLREAIVRYPLLPLVSRCVRDN